MSSTSSFNRADFQQTVQLVGVKIPNKEVNKITQQFKRHLFVRPRIKRVYEVENDQDKRIVLLSETYSDTSLHSILDTDFKTYLESIKADPVKYPLQLTYEHQSVEEILTKVLPSGVEIPSSYEQVGHIAHLNLRDQVLPFKTIVGQVLLDKNPSLRTVVNKIGSIETEFRTFPMEVIAGESVFEVTVRESGAIFNFNFQNVYWNSRLQTEHSRMIDWIRESSSLKKVADNNQKTIVADMMAGVGPFAVPLAMSSAIQVHANDLNPESYKYLVVNTKTNKCGRNLFNYNLDGRFVFIYSHNIVFDC